MLCLVTQSCPTLCDPMDCSPPGSSVHGDSPGKSTRVDCHALLQGNLPNPGIKSRSPALQVDSLPSEPPGKPKNTGVGSLSPLQGYSPTRELNQGLPHCRKILYQLSYQGSPINATKNIDYLILIINFKHYPTLLQFGDKSIVSVIMTSVNTIIVETSKMLCLYGF